MQICVICVLLSCQPQIPNELDNGRTLIFLLDERQIEHLLVGGIALLQYVRGRNTEVIELIIAFSDLKKEE